MIRRVRGQEQADDNDTGLDTRLIWAGLFVSLAIFAKVPNVDLWFSQRYYAPGVGFFNADQPLVRALYDYTPVVGHSLLVVALLVAVGARGWARLARACGHPALAPQILGLWRRTAIATLLVAVLSSGIAVELGFKGMIGRPRPVQTVEFGGQEPFHAAFALGRDPKKHRSFVSGHAAAGFSLVSLGLCAGPVWRRRWLLIGVVTGSVVGMGRIMQGGHYLSDVVFSFYVVWLSCELVALGLRWHDRRAARQAPGSA